MMNVRNILELVMEETLEYVVNLETKKHFVHDIKKYTELHNKGIFINFTYNSNDAQGLFGSPVFSYGISQEDVTVKANPKFSRRKVVLISDLIKRLEKEKDLKSKELTNIKDITGNMKIRMQRENMTEDPEQEKVKSFIDLASKVYLSRFNKEYEISDAKLKIVRRIDENIRYLETSLKTKEMLLFKQVVRYFMKRLQKYTESIFGVSVRLEYSFDEWTKSFLEVKGRNQYHYDNPFDKNDRLTPFEKRLMYVVNIKAKELSFVISKNEYEYCLQFKTGQISLNNKMRKRHEEKQKIQKIYEELNFFMEKHKGLMVLVSSLNEVEKKLGSEHELKQVLLSAIFATYPKEVIEEYNKYNKEITEAERNYYERQDDYFSEYENPCKIASDFPYVVIEFEKVLDLNYKYLLKQEKYNEVITSIKANGLVLELHNSKKENNNSFVTHLLK